MNHKECFSSLYLAEFIYLFIYTSGKSRGLQLQNTEYMKLNMRRKEEDILNSLDRFNLNGILALQAD